MKLIDIVEQDEWTPTPFEDRKSELNVLNKHIKLLQYQMDLLHNKRQDLLEFLPIQHPEIVKIDHQLENLNQKFIKTRKRIRELTITGYTFCFTGFRDVEMERLIMALGGRVTTGVSGNTDYLIALDPYENSGKIQKANKLNCPILSKAKMKQILRV